MQYQLDDIQSGELRDKNSQVPTFPLMNTLGLYFAEAIPDINNNEKDEIGLVYYHADWSSVNSYMIVELDENNNWSELYGFEIRDWEFPDHPWYTDRPSMVIHKEQKLTSYTRVTKLESNSFEYDGYNYISSYDGQNVRYAYKDESGYWFYYLELSDEYELFICCPECDNELMQEIEEDSDYYFCLGCRFKYRVVWK